MGTSGLRQAEEVLTARLSLRRPTAADVDAIFSINGDELACAHNPADLLASRGEALRLFRRSESVGSGLATEAASAVTGWAAGNIPDRTVIARIRPLNGASQRVAIRAGLARAEELDIMGEDGLDWIFVRARS
jgi:[ribosomal protein S5]-alanine N-acetyltransferase